MGAGRKTQTVQFDTGAAAYDFERCQRNLGEDLGGVIFGCSGETFAECVEGLVFGLPRPHMCYVQNIKPGMPVFLFNYTERRMYGIYRAVTEGDWEINPRGWIEFTGGTRTRYPAQVQVEVYKACPSLPETTFKPILIHCYSTDAKLNFELKNSEAAAMCRAFDKAAAALAAKQRASGAPASAAPADPDGWQTVTGKKPFTPSGPTKENAWASGAPAQAPTGFPTPAEAARGITAVPDPTSSEPPPRASTPAPVTAERSMSGASSASGAPAAAAAASPKGSGPGGPMVAKPAARKPPPAPASRDTGAAIPPPKDDKEKEKEKEKARAKAAAEAEKPAEPERPPRAPSAEPARTSSPAPSKPDYNYARAGLPGDDGLSTSNGPSSAPQDNPKADPYAFALAPLPDARTDPENTYPGAVPPSAPNG
ncbi:hypothetical protein WJX84_000466 [Apatococcus fuscideae]|uniref:DCD domain-containing protein n=1 Tax=Apatococcus fuscideae TaxID=2026836 RepID=A0AAW1T066_9CHLO